MEDNQVLNQGQDVTVDDTTTESNDDSNFFSTPNDVEEVEPTENQQEETVETHEEPKPFSLHVKYNDEEKDLNEDDARMYAQKGLNYDKIYDPLQKLAKLNGMQVGEYLNSLSEIQTEHEVDNELASLKEKYPDTPEEVLNELAQKRVSENQNLQFKQMEDEKKGNDEALKAEADRQIKRFMEEYPDVDPTNLDVGIIDYVKKGYSLLEAYNKWNRVQEEKNRPVVEAKEKVEKQNEENKKKSLGNMTNAGGESTESGDFFKGMDSI